MRSLTLNINGPLHVADFGGKGMPMVLVHGLGGSHLNWLSVGPALASHHRVFAIDLPGFGLSPDAGRRATVPDNVEVVTQALAQLCDRPAIVLGNSMGGLLSLGAAVANPERFAGLILVNPALPLPRGQAFRFDPFIREFVFAYALPGLGARRFQSIAGKLGPEALVWRTLSLCCADPHRIDPDVVRAHVEQARQRMQRPGWHDSFFDAAGSLFRTLAVRSRIERWIVGDRVPTLLVHGVQDRVVSFRSAGAAADLRPDWDFAPLEDVGHIPMLEAPRVFLDVVTAWLARQPWYRHNAKPAAIAG